MGNEAEAIFVNIARKEEPRRVDIFIEFGLITEVLV